MNDLPAIITAAWLAKAMGRSLSAAQRAMLRLPSVKLGRERIILREHFLEAMRDLAEKPAPPPRRVRNEKALEALRRRFPLASERGDGSR